MAAGQDTDPKAPRASRRMRIVLFVSLALNLLVVGAIVGHVVSDDGPRRASARVAPDAIMPYTRALEPRERRALGRDFRRKLDKRPRGSGAAILAGYREALSVLRNDPFDAAAMNAVLEQQSAVANARREAGQATLISYLSTLSAQDRARYADKLEAEVKRLSERRKRWDQERKP